MRLVRSSRLQAPALVDVVTPGLPATTGVEQSFSDMYQRMHGRAIDLASRFVGYDAACDAVHEATIELWKRWTIPRKP